MLQPLLMLLERSGLVGKRDGKPCSRADESLKGRADLAAGGDAGAADWPLMSRADPSGMVLDCATEPESTITLQYRPVWLSLMMTGELGCMDWLGLLGLMGT